MFTARGVQLPFCPNSLQRYNKNCIYANFFNFYRKKYLPSNGPKCFISNPICIAFNQHMTSRVTRTSKMLYFTCAKM